MANYALPYFTNIKILSNNFKELIKKNHIFVNLLL